MSKIVKKKTLYIADLDGTLLKNDKTISVHSTQILNTLLDQGVLFTYATARSHYSAYPLVKKLHIKCPVIVFNGAFVVDPESGRRLAQNVYTEASKAQAQTFFMENDIAPLVYARLHGRERISYIRSRADDVKRFLDTHTKDRRLRAVKDYDELFDGDVFFFTMIDPPPAKEYLGRLDDMFDGHNGFSRRYEKDTYSDMMWYEIYSERASKATAARQLYEMVDAERLICFGDNYNDISMLREADIGCAVANAENELKRNSDIIISSNENDGVADFIERFENDKLPKKRKGKQV